MRIRFSAGDFTDFDREKTTRVAVINEAMARAIWPDQDAIGKRFASSPISLVQVIGVVGTTVVGQSAKILSRRISPQRQQYSPFGTLVVVRTHRAADRPVRAQIQRLTKSGVHQRADRPGKFLGQGLWPRAWVQLCSASSARSRSSSLRLEFTACWPIPVAQRTSEIGLRMALGAQPRQVLALVLRQGMLLALIGATAGILVALPVARQAAGLLYGVSATDPLTYVGITLLLMAVALLACYLPARRATRIHRSWPCASSSRVGCASIGRHLARSQG